MRRVSLQTPEGFRSLAATLLPARALDIHQPAIEVADACAAVGDLTHNGDPTDDELELGREVRLFRARVIEAVEASVEMLVNDIAADVLGRELALAPADVEAIVDRALERFAREEPLRVRVHADDAAALRCAVPVVTDARLRPGDAVIELRDGNVDASLGVRLETLVRAVLA